VSKAWNAHARRTSSDSPIRAYSLSLSSNSPRCTPPMREQFLIKSRKLYNCRLSEESKWVSNESYWTNMTKEISSSF
jgi:hypothetical protein